MANELALNASLTYTKNSVVINEAINALLVTVTGNGLNSLNSFSATTAAIAIPLGSSTSAGGWIFVMNLDPTNYVNLLTGTSGTIFGRLLPGEFALFRFDASVTAPAVQAHTSACQIKFCLFDT